MYLREHNDLKVGETIIVYGYWKAKIESIFLEHTTKRIKLNIDWGNMGKSRVFAQDEGKIWTRISKLN